jgi:hypothetical protein
VNTWSKRSNVTSVWPQDFVHEFGPLVNHHTKPFVQKKYYLSVGGLWSSSGRTRQSVSTHWPSQFRQIIWKNLIKTMIKSHISSYLRDQIVVY